MTIPYSITWSGIVVVYGELFNTFRQRLGRWAPFAFMPQRDLGVLLDSSDQPCSLAVLQILYDMPDFVDRRGT